MDSREIFAQRIADKHIFMIDVFDGLDIAIINLDVCFVCVILFLPYPVQVAVKSKH